MLWELIFTNISCSLLTHRLAEASRALLCSPRSRPCGFCVPSCPRGWIPAALPHLELPSKDLPVTRSQNEPRYQALCH